MKKLSELPVGAKIKDVATQYNGEIITWLIGGHGHYANNQTALMSEKIITLKAVDAAENTNANTDRKTNGNNRYTVSNIRQWLNSATISWYTPQHSVDAPPTNENVSGNCNEYDQEGGFLTNFSDDLRNNLLDTTLIVAKNTVTDGGSYETFVDKVFLLSATEVGLSNENNIAEGKVLPFFTANTRSAYPTKQAIEKNEYVSPNLKPNLAWYWFLRTPSSTTTGNMRDILPTGTNYTGHTANNGTNGIRPALNIHSDTVISDEPDSDGAYWLFRNPKTTHYLFAKDKKAYTIASGAIKELEEITTANISTLFANGLETITKEDCILVGQQLGKAKIMRMLV